MASSSLITGFSDYSLAGDSGGWLKLDIGSPYVALRFIPGFHTNLAFSLLKGWVPHRSDSQPQHGSASAAQIAFTVVGQGLSLNLQVGKRLEAPSYNQIKADVPDVGLTLSYSI